MLTLNGSAFADVVPGMGTWTQTLQGRDLDRDGAIDAFYDQASNLTWLRDAGLSGMRRYDDAARWVDQFEFAGVRDWRMPSARDSTGRICEGYRCTDTEMGHLWLIVLGNLDLTVFNGNSPIRNTGPFERLEGYYWTNSDEPGGSWQDYFYVHTGLSSYAQANFLEFRVLLVHDGDLGTVIGQVPEPGMPLIVVAVAALAARGAGRPRMRMWLSRQSAILRLS